MLPTAERDKIILGVDVSKGHLDMYLHPFSTRARVENAGRAISKWLKDNVPSGAIVVFEATGGYERVLQKALVKRTDLVARRIHPARVKSYARALNKRAKNDQIDAQMIAQAAAWLGDDLHDTTPPAYVQELRDLLMRRGQLQDMQHAEQCRVKMAEISCRVRHSLEQNIMTIQTLIADMDTQIRTLIAAHGELRERAERLETVKGVGEQIAAVVLAFLPELGRVNRKQIAALAGLAPITRQSGKSHGRAKVYGGRQTLKKALYMAALVGIRHNPTLKAFYQSLLENQKPKMVALIATARKLVTHLNAIEKKELTH